MARILIIDDDKNVCQTLSHILGKHGHRSVLAHTLKAGVACAAAGDFDVVFLDVLLPDGNGLEMLPTICRTPSSPEVIIITGAGSPEGVELAIESGAWDYIQKSSSPKSMIFPLIRALQYREKKLAVQQKQRAFNREGILGESPSLNRCLDFLSHAAGTDTTVLLTGETGTGKELFARAIHDNSARKENLFVIVDCAALPETLVSSVLFGHRRGAFTGADSTQDGLLKQADGGTLFLDEVGELPLSIQKDFLRAIQERRFRPVGGDHEVVSDFRLVTATNRDLETMAENGQFRPDLLYRLNVFSIRVPPLREHMEDLQSLARYHVARLCKNYRLEKKDIAADVFNALASYEWPGNVRELFNALDRAVTAAQYEPVLFVKHLPRQIRTKVIQASLKAPVLDHHDEAIISGFLDRFSLEDLPELKLFREQMDRIYLQKLMQLTHQKKNKASEVSGLSRTRLFELLKKYST